MKNDILKIEKIADELDEAIKAFNNRPLSLDETQVVARLSAQINLAGFTLHEIAKGGVLANFLQALRRKNQREANNEK